MAKRPHINPTLIKMMRQKASLVNLKTRIAAFAFSKKGNLLGTSTNNISDWNSYEEYRRRCETGETCKYSGRHAEAELMKRHGKKINTILIMRIGHGGDILKIEPCEKCRKIADKLGVKIISVDQEDCQFPH